MVHDHESERHMKRLNSCLQGRGHSKAFTSQRRPSVPHPLTTEHFTTKLDVTIHHDKLVYQSQKLLIAIFKFKTQWGFQSSTNSCLPYLINAEPFATKLGMVVQQKELAFCANISFYVVFKVKVASRVQILCFLIDFPPRSFELFAAKISVLLCDHWTVSCKKQLGCLKP